MNSPNATRFFGSRFSDELQQEIIVIVLLAILYVFALNLVASHVGSTRRLIFGDVEGYFTIFNALKDGSFSKHLFTYSIGLPLMGFLGRGLKNPFIPFTFLAFMICSSQLYLILKFFFRPVLSIFLLLIILATSPFVLFFLTSQTSIITATLILYLFSVLLRSQPLNIIDSIIIGFFLGLDFASRYIDPIFFVPLLSYLLYRDLKINGRKTITHGLIIGGLSMLWVFITLYFHKNYFGSYFHTPYATHFPFVDRIGMGNEDILNHMHTHYFYDTFRNLYQVFIDPTPYALPYDIDHRKSLFFHMPYLLFIFVGLFYWIKEKRPSKVGLICLALTFFSMLIFYGSFWAFTAHDIKFGCLRYLSGWYPIAGAISLYGLKRLYDLIRDQKNVKLILVYLFFTVAVHIVIVNVFAMIPKIDNHLTKRVTYERKNWIIHTNKNPQDVLKMIDNDLRTRWTTGTPMVKGDHIVIDIGKVLGISQIRFDLRDRAENDFPLRLKSYYSSDGDNFVEIKGIKSGRQNHIWKLEFSMIQAREIKIEIGKACSYWWSIYEIYLLN